MKGKSWHKKSPCIHVPYINLDELKGNTNVQNMKSAIHKLEKKIYTISTWHKIYTIYYKCMAQDIYYIL